MNSDYKKAFRELDCILQNADSEIIDKIPERFIKYMKINMDNSYIPNINCNDSLENQDLLEETRELMAIVYRDYLVDDEERKVLLKNEKDIQEKIEAEKREKYKIEFKQKEMPKELIKVENENDKWYVKIWKKIINIYERFRKFNRN